MAEEATTTTEQTATITQEPAQTQAPAENAVNTNEAVNANEALRRFKENSKGSEEPKKTEDKKEEPKEQPKVEEAKTEPKKEEPKPAKKDKTPSEFREARIKELKKIIKERDGKINEAINAKDEVETKLQIFERQKAIEEQHAISRENYFEKAAEEEVPDIETYKELTSFYAEKIDKPELDSAIRECQNPHCVLYTLMEYFEQDPGNLETWNKMTPIAIRRALLNTDKIISEAKAKSKATEPLKDVSTQTAQPAKEQPRKEIPKSVVAQTSDSTAAGPKSAKGMKPDDALRHFKLHGPSGVADDDE